MKEYNTMEIVNKLVGPTIPIGETIEDDKRLDNMRELCSLVDYLLGRIKDSTHYIDSHEYSVRKIAQYAQQFLNTIEL